MHKPKHARTLTHAHSRTHTLTPKPDFCRLFHRNNYLRQMIEAPVPSPTRQLHNTKRNIVHAPRFPPKHNHLRQRACILFALQRKALVRVGLPLKPEHSTETNAHKRVDHVVEKFGRVINAAATRFCSAIVQCEAARLQTFWGRPSLDWRPTPVGLDQANRSLHRVHRSNVTHCVIADGREIANDVGCHWRPSSYRVAAALPRGTFENARPIQLSRRCAPRAVGADARPGHCLLLKQPHPWVVGQRDLMCAIIRIGNRFLHLPRCSVRVWRTGC